MNCEFCCSKDNISSQNLDNDQLINVCDDENCLIEVNFFSAIRKTILKSITINGVKYKRCFKNSSLISNELYTKLKRIVGIIQIKYFNYYISDLNENSILELNKWFKKMLERHKELKNLLFENKHKIFMKFSYISNFKEVAMAPIPDLPILVNLVHSFIKAKSKIDNLDKNPNLIVDKNYTRLNEFAKKFNLLPRTIYDELNESFLISMIPLSLFDFNTTNDSVTKVRYSNIFNKFLDDIPVEFRDAVNEQFDKVFVYLFIYGDDLRFMNFYIQSLNIETFGIQYVRRFKNVINLLGNYFEFFDQKEKSDYVKKLDTLYYSIFEKYQNEQNKEKYEGYLARLDIIKYDKMVLKNVLSMLIIDTFFDDLLLFDPFGNNNLEQLLSQIDLNEEVEYNKIRFIGNKANYVTLVKPSKVSIIQFFKKYFIIGVESYDKSVGNIFIYFDNILK